MWPFKKKSLQGLQSVDDRGWTRIFDWQPGAWQQHAAYDKPDSVVSYAPVFSCITLIAGDICKLRPTIEKKQQDVWIEAETDASKVLRNPNTYQNHLQFFNWWMSSKLIHGNTYALKVRRGRDIVGLYLLDPTRVTPLVSDFGEVFYQLAEDNLAGIQEGRLVVPASEIIHDRDNCLYHPLIGLPPLYACTVSGGMGIKMQGNAKAFFENGSSPSGVLTAPGSISNDTATRLKEYWQTNFSGTNSGKIVVAGDGLKYEPMRMSNVDAQMLEILKWTAESVCSVFHVPAYMAGVGALPTYNNIEALTQQYYGQCLQKHIESMELCLYNGLEIKDGYRVQMDLDGLFRMDTSTLMETLQKGVSGTIMSSNEARKRLNLPPVKGGEAPLSQQQYYSLEALAERDATNPLAMPAPAPAVEPDDDDSEDEMKVYGLLLSKELNLEAA
jgi:HK97 family phage portal protein